MRTPTLVGARVPRARRHPTPARGSVVGRPAAPRAGGGPPGTSAPTIVPPAPTWPLPLSHPHPLGPYHSPTRTHLAPTIVPPAPTRPLPLSRPHPLGPYHSPARTHSAPTLALQRPGARSTRAALGAGRPLSPTPCVHPMRPPHARPVRRETLPQKSDFFFVIEGCRRHTFMCRASRGYAPRPIKQGESGVSGGVCAACIFFRGPLARTAAVWYTHGVFDHGRGFGWDVRPWVNAGRFKERSAEVEEGTTS